MGLAVDTDCNLRADVEIPVKLCNLPPLNAIASRVLALSADPDVDLKRLTSVIECDPAFAADILVVANSPLFGFRSRVPALRDAIAVLGLEQLNALAITVAMRGFLGRSAPAVRPCWRHSVASAVIASEIAPSLAISGEAAFTLSLLHDVGRLGLLKSYPSEYARILGGTYQDAEAVLRAERAAFQVDHGRAGGWLVRSWAFPQPFLRVCEDHHEPPGAHDPQLFQVVKLSCAMADALDFSAVRYAQPRRYEEIVGILPKGACRDSFPAEADLRESVERRIKSFL